MIKKPENYSNISSLTKNHINITLLRKSLVFSLCFLFNFQTEFSTFLGAWISWCSEAFVAFRLLTAHDSRQLSCAEGNQQQLDYPPEVNAGPSRSVAIIWMGPIKLKPSLGSKTVEEEYGCRAKTLRNNSLAFSFLTLADFLLRVKLWPCNSNLTTQLQSKCSCKLKMKKTSTSKLYVLLKDCYLAQHLSLTWTCVTQTGNFLHRAASLLLEHIIPAKTLLCLTQKLSWSKNFTLHEHTPAVKENDFTGKWMIPTI